MSRMHMANSFDPSTGAVDVRDRDLLARRQRSMGAAYRLFYSRPVSVTRASGVRLFDEDGADYLDAYNNVPVVGHSNPRVAEAVSEALRTLSTHTRYLTTAVVDYSERLVGLFPDPITQLVYACTGSEAVDLALRIARHVTARRGVIVTEHAYHGTTQATAEISPSLGPHNAIPDHVITIPVPDPLRSDMTTARLEILHSVRRAIGLLEERGHGVAALLVDSVMISDGLVVDDAPLLDLAVAAVREAGGLYIADEVQAGFGRTGQWWGFSAHDVVPDLVVLGKPMGNGMPISAVVGRPEYFDRFGADVRYFNTFGGNGASVAAASAVLDELETRRLVQHTREVGTVFAEGLRERLGRGALADVRARGLMLAAEFADVDTGIARPDRARGVVDALRDRRVLVSASGPLENVVKIRPPLVFDENDVARFLDAFDEVLDID